jgi:PucR family transcriptional regulator, purine catabolism regulatory protein
MSRTADALVPRSSPSSSRVGSTRDGPSDSWESCASIPGHVTMLAVTSDHGAKLRDIHVALWRNGLPHLVMHRSGLLYLLSADERPLHEVVSAHLGPEACLEVSGVIKAIERIPEAAWESGWAVGAAARTGFRTVR